MTRAYVLISTRVYEAAHVAEVLSNEHDIPVEEGRIICAHVIIGPHSIIAEIEAPDLNAIGRIVMKYVQKIASIESTITCPVVDLEEE